jgi:hypothetical protein
MQHTCYHVISDHKNQFFSAVDDVKETVNKWKDEGESHIKIFRIITEDLGSDAIDLEEKQVGLDEININ